MHTPSTFLILVQVFFGALSLVPLLDEGLRMAYAVISLFVGGLNLGIAWVALRSRSPAKGA